MVKIEPKENYSNFKSINGNDLKLYIQDVPACVQVTIINTKKSLYQKCILLFISAIFNSLLLLFNIVTINVILGILFLTLLFLYTVCIMPVEENLFIVKNFGIEISKRNVIGTKKIFYPQERVQRIFINEVIFRRKVLFVLTLLINDLDSELLVPLFVDVLPQLALLKVIYSRIRHKIN